MPPHGQRTVIGKNTSTPSIDAVLESPAAKTVASLLPPIARPSASTRPSWIGPKAPDQTSASGAVVMKIPVTIEFSSPGLQPPVYICTSLSDPQWEPLEMEGARNDKGEYKFSKTFDAKEGEYQYKLRLGPGDWWICDDSKPQVDDGLGNKNNLISVKADGEPHRVDSVHNAPLMPHESHHTPTKPQDFLFAADRHEVDDQHTSPLMAHESITPLTPHHDSHDEHEPESLPLLKHESNAPSSQEQNHSPLFRHEATAIDDQQYEDRQSKSPSLSSRKHSSTSIPEEADPNEPGLEQFPTDHRGILDSIARTKENLAEDETSEHPGRLSPSSSPSSAIAPVSPPLPSVMEDEEEHEDRKKAATEQIPRVQISEPNERPAALMTPPMTPKEEKQIDHIAGRLQEKSQKVLEGAKSTAEKVKATTGKAVDAVQETDYSSVLAGFGFALAVALTAVGLWYFRGAGSLEMVEA